MTSLHISSRRKLAVLAASVALLQAGHAATVLSGTGLGDNNNLAANYGSNLAGTPNLALTWSPVNPTGGNGYDGWQTYATWTNMSATNTTGTGVYQMGEGGTAVPYDILFTPTAGFGVQFSSVDINVYNGGNTFSLVARVMNAAATTTYQSFNITQAAGNGTHAINFTSTDSSPVLLRFEVVTVGRTGAYLAMDNLSFDQVTIPEPSTALLGLAGLGALALRRRRA